MKITSSRVMVCCPGRNFVTVKIEPDEVVIGPGGKPILFFPTMAIIEPGDEVIYPNPGFPTYEAMIKVAGGIPVPVPLLEENQFSFDIEVFDSLIKIGRAHV